MIPVRPTFQHDSSNSHRTPAIRRSRAFSIAHFLCAVLLAWSPASSSAAEQAGKDSATDAEKQEAEIVTTIKARLEVEDSAPYVPASNTIAAKLPIEQVWTPANIGTVDGVLFREQQADTVNDALENVSGINVQSGSGVFDFFVMRGFDSLTSGLVLLDGAPEPESTYYQLFDAERVEVLKGPAGFLYGSNPLAGVVNIVRKQPVPHQFATFGLTAGSFGNREGRLDLNSAGEDGVLSFRLNGLWRESNGYRDGREESVTAIHPGFAWRPDDRRSLTLNLDFVNSDFVPDAGLPLIDGQLPDLPRRRSYASPLDDSQQDIRRLQLDYEVDVSEHFTVRDKLYYRELDWLTRGTLVSGVIDFGFGPEVFRTLLDLDDEQSVLGNQLELLWRNERHQLLAGVEFQRQTDDFSLGVGFLPTISLFSPVEAEQIVVFPIPGQGSTGATETTVVAPYIVDQIRLSDRVQLLLGARLDSIDFDDAVSGTSRSDSELSPMAGLVFAPTAKTSLYLNAARSFAPASPRVTGDREPEESRQLEAGVRRSFAGGRLHGTLAAYQLERDNIAIPDDNGFTQQAGDQRSQGVELELGGQLTPKLTASFAYAYTDAELTRFAELIQLPFPPFFITLDRSGNNAAFAPEHLLNLWLSKSFDNGWRLAGGLRHLEDQFIAEDNTTTIDAHTLLDAALSYSFDRWRLSLNVDNLSDEQYETRGFGSFSVIPGEPLSASLRVELRL